MLSTAMQHTPFRQPQWGAHTPTSPKTNTTSLLLTQANADAATRPYKQPHYHTLWKRLCGGEGGGAHAGHKSASLDMLMEVDVLTNHQPNIALLDLGCGEGETAAMFKEMRADWIVYGMDASPHAIAVARNRSNTVEFIEASAFFCPLEDNSVDVVIAEEPDFLISEYRQVILAHVLRVLKPGGLFLMALVGIPWVSDPTWSATTLLTDMKAVSFHIVDSHEISNLSATFYKRARRRLRSCSVGAKTNTTILDQATLDVTARVDEILEQIEHKNVKFGLRLVASKS